MDSIVHGVAKNRTRLSNFHLITYIYHYIIQGRNDAKAETPVL